MGEGVGAAADEHSHKTFGGHHSRSLTPLLPSLIMLFKKLARLFSGNPLKRYESARALVSGLEKEIAACSGEELRARSDKLRANPSLPEAFALAREAARRALGQRAFDVQIIGGMVLHDGKVAEMLTGEGKTLAAVMPVYLNALAGKGVHVVTVNDYLAKRDTVWMGQVYDMLGCTVSCITNDEAFRYDAAYGAADASHDKERDVTGGFKVVEEFLRPVGRKEAYAADITYGTNHAFGFDYLRDNLVMNLSDRVQRGHHYAVIDEVDSILIDEARTPLIISAPDAKSSNYYRTFARIMKKLDAPADYEVDEKKQSVNITEAGIEKVEHALGVKNIFAPEHTELVHYLNESLRAKGLFRRDKEYVVREGKVIIVDQFTGRLLAGRRYSGGLHQAIEAREGVSVEEENKTYAEISIQNYFRYYEKIAGMTGTAQTSAEEFASVYNLEVISIPLNKNMVRHDLSDLIYKARDAKYRAVVEDVKRRHEAGQPVLLGTTSIEHNEELSRYLAKAGIPHEVLNAKNNEREGAIIAQAGARGAVTVATNMAGRGVDIVLGGNPGSEAEHEKVKELGGLCVLGTERHEARRIDNQLRGRSGRQGDPGVSQFFLSLEDDLMRIFGGERLSAMMQALHIPEDMPIESALVTRAVNHAQRRVEGIHLDMRKHLLEFDDVLNRQRNAVYAERLRYLEAGEADTITPIVEELGASVPAVVTKELSVRIGQHLVRVLDFLWMEHLETLHDLRESVNIRAYAQHEPLVEYRREAYLGYQALRERFKDIAQKTLPKLFGTGA
ncbi:preprotein translocase subunit SecA [Candidatus Jorgensenbacteria bacterium GWA1_54_12]|uniref:Protein translocase subunit SecA n=1 Tax=Candidatus Jorgensenbacteria bacterium GWA1_54_12 TaxID=1798468 RepID=A0A1F6BLF8_9BACT|nr:MAG: preprotein translocase subunit SecA [Candidatus Jorgensenbacteria bacterium GWA1_54_12]